MQLTRGSQYNANAYKYLLKEYNLLDSMSRKGAILMIMRQWNLSIEYLKQNISTSELLLR
jgi:hypothetical protein